MKKFINVIIILLALFIIQGCSVKKNIKITKEMAYEGVNNYCHKEYDWSIAKDNPSIMYVEMGDETETDYQVIFRSYTGSFIYFYVEKASGITKMVENVPDLDIKSDLGTIQLLDYLG